MPRKQSPETELRHMRSMVKYLNEALGEHLEDVRILTKEVAAANAEIAEWKKRFDALLFHGYKEKS